MKNKIMILSVLSLFFLTSLVLADEKFFEIKAKKFEYSPNVIKVNKGDTVRLRLISQDVHHGFYLDGYEIKTSAHPGQEGSLKFVADKNGKFVFRCSVTCGEFHPYMVGYLVVEPNVTFRNFVYIIIGLGGLLFLIIVFKTSNHAPKIEGPQP
ncbi:MAG: cupredoxin domain-containing protein [Planctomycetota bacterium]